MKCFQQREGPCEREFRKILLTSLLRISAGVRRQRRLLKPMVRLVANMQVSSMMIMMMMMMMIMIMTSHQGNEAVGREIVMQLGQHLLMGYGRVSPASSKQCVISS